MPTKGELTHLYCTQLLSTPEIAARLDLSIWKVVYLMRKYDIPRRHQSQTRRVQFLRSPLSYQKIVPKTLSEHKLFCSGLMLYWAEGSKKSKHSVDFANCDERALLLFHHFLRSIYRIKEDKLRVYLYCYSNQDVNELIKYWADTLGISPVQFSKPYIRSDYKKDKIGKMPHGLIHIRYHDSRLLMQIMEDIDIMYHRIMNC